MAEKMTLTLFLAMLQTFVRSFFLQTLWNFERMQNVGFAFAAEPLLRLASTSKAHFHKLLRRHLAFFNTHPYFAPIVIGVVYRKELAHPSDSEDRTIPVLKDTMGGAFGGVGDHVIWGTWRPFCAVLAIGIGGLVAYPTRDWSLCAKWWGTGFGVLFTSVHLWLRWQGLSKGVAEGPAVVQWLSSLRLQAWAVQVRRLGLLLLLVLVLGYLHLWETSPILLWMVTILLSSIVLRRLAVSGFFIFYGVCAVSILMAFWGIHWP